MHYLPAPIEYVLDIPLFLYLNISDVANSAVLVTDEANDQPPIYYVSKFFILL